MLPVSLDCPFLIVPSVFSNITRTIIVVFLMMFQCIKFSLWLGMHICIIIWPYTIIWLYNCSILSILFYKLRSFTLSKEIFHSLTFTHIVVRIMFTHFVVRIMFIHFVERGISLSYVQSLCGKNHVHLLCDKNYVHPLCCKNYVHSLCGKRYFTHLRSLPLW